MVQIPPETGPESRGGDRPDWDKAVAGEALPEIEPEISLPPESQGGGGKP